MSDAAAERPASAETAKLIYVLYLVGLVVGITTIIGVVMAYINRDAAPDWLKTHYQLQIRTFWMSVLYGTISIILCFVLIGFLLLFVLLIWWIIRCVKGLRALEQQQPYPDPTGWGF